MYRPRARCAWLVLLVAVIPLAQAATFADLSVTKTVDDATPIIGQAVCFTVTVTNAGPRAANAVLVRDRLPTGYAYVSHTVSRGTYIPSSGNWSLGLPAGASGELALVATVKAQGNRVNIAEVRSSSLHDPDSIPGNGNPAEDDYASQSTTPGAPNVPPIITGQVPLSTPEDTPLTIALAHLTVVDPDDDWPVNFTLTVQPGASYSVVGNQVRPVSNFTGALTVPVIVDDGEAESAPFPLLITVTPVNDAPVITGQVELDTIVAAPLTIRLADLTVADPDDVYPQDFTLAVQLGSGYDVTGDGEITPAAGFSGVLAVGVTVHDGALQSPPFDVEVMVKRPNIVVIMLDDVDSRSLDELLSAGLMPALQTHVVDHAVEFTQSYVSLPLCCPSRATFLSGNYPHNTNVLNNFLYYEADAEVHRAVGQFDDSVTVATRLQSAGYTTMAVGKYLNGYGSNSALTNLSPAFLPRYVPPGWKSWNVTIDFSSYCVYNYTMNRNGTLIKYERPIGQSEDSDTYQTNVYSDIVESLVLEHRDDTAPFFLWITPLTAHTEACIDAYGGPPPTDEFAKRIRPAPEFKNTPVPPFVASPAYDEDLSDKPTWMQRPPLSPVDVQNIIEGREARLRAILSIDLMVNRLVAALGNARDDTVLVFTSDNGWYHGEHRLTGKILAYQEALRVPLYIGIPGVTDRMTRSQVVLNNDLAPTILNLASPGYGDSAFDGRSLIPLLEPGVPQNWTERAHFLVEYARSTPGPEEDPRPTYRALRSATSLYVESYDRCYWQPGDILIGLERYDLTTDPDQLDSLIHQSRDPKDPVLTEWLDLLESCAGDACKQYENGVSP